MGDDGEGVARRRYEWGVDVFVSMIRFCLTLHDAAIARWTVSWFDD